ncbi:MAG: ThiF family adenylyltransferase [Nanoarchaeota archaeon]|nr:ThiF family adenylyltransferase [Nanoarchaeota archaeon]
MSKVKIKDSLYLFKETEDIYQVGFTSIRKIRRIKLDTLSKDLLNYLIDKDLDLKNLQVSLKNHGYNLIDIDSALNTLNSLGIIEFFDKNKIDERNKYQLSFLNEISSSRKEAEDLQKRIEQSHIAIFGVGGIGSWIVNGLYQLGVKNLTINDPDKIEESNLNRQLYFSSRDIGRYKVDVLKEKLLDCNIDTHKRYVSNKMDLEDIISNKDFIINCTDNPSIQVTTKIISEYAEKNNIAYSFAGGYNFHTGMLGSIFIPNKTVCFDCFLRFQDQNNPYKGLEVLKKPKGSGNLGPMAGTIANLHVMDIFKYLTGKGSFNSNRYAEVDFLNLDINWMEFSSYPDCEKCKNID